MKLGLLSPLAAAVALLALAACAPKPVELGFVDHVKAGMIEQDVYVEKAAGSGQVFRINPDEFEAYKDAQVFATTKVVHHAPFNADRNGPYPKGRTLGMTLADWLSASGSASYVCKGDQGTIDASFTKLVPNGLYTMWYAFAGKGHMGCKDCPFATVDFPMGKPDGSQSFFTAGADGSAGFKLDFSPCLELSGERLMAMLAIAYHSDGNTYGPDPGPFGLGSHVQLFVALPDKGAK